MALLRLLKGCLSAWEHWLKTYADDPPSKEADRKVS